MAAALGSHQLSAWCTEQPPSSAAAEPGAAPIATAAAGSTASAAATAAAQHAGKDTDSHSGHLPLLSGSMRSLPQQQQQQQRPSIRGQGLASKMDPDHSHDNTASASHSHDEVGKIMRELQAQLQQRLRDSIPAQQGAPAMIFPTESAAELSSLAGQVRESLWCLFSQHASAEPFEPRERQIEVIGLCVPVGCSSTQAAADCTASEDISGELETPRQMSEQHIWPCSR